MSGNHQGGHVTKWLQQNDIRFGIATRPVCQGGTSDDGMFAVAGGIRDQKRQAEIRFQGSVAGGQATAPRVAIGFIGQDGAAAGHDSSIEGIQIVELESGDDVLGSKIRLVHVDDSMRKKIGRSRGTVLNFSEKTEAAPGDAQSIRKQLDKRPFKRLCVSVAPQGSSERRTDRALPFASHQTNCLAEGAISVKRLRTEGIDDVVEGWVF